MPPPSRTGPTRPALVLAVAFLLTACGSAAASGPDAASSGDGAPVELRLGYFPNVTHATALVGVEEGFFADALGDDVTLTTATFNAGPAAIEALFSDAIDADVHRPQPDGQRLRPVPGRGRPRHLRRRLRRRLPRRARGHRLARGPGGHDASPPPARQHPGRRAALLAHGAGPDQRPGRRRRRRHRPAGERADPRRLRRRRHRRRLGARAERHPPHRGRREGPRRRAGPVARRPVRHDEPHRQPRLPRGAPRRGPAPARGPGGRHRVAERQPRGGADRRRRRHRGAVRQAAARGGHRPRPGRTSSSPTTRSRRPCSRARRTPPRWGRSRAARPDLDGLYDLSLLNEVLAERGLPEVEEP